MGNSKGKIMNENLFWITKWYHSQCDGYWEHDNGIHIGTLDNPGWFLEVDIKETEIQDKEFLLVDIDRSEEDWIYCSIEDKMFKGSGGPFNLPELLKIFCDWAKE
jgi:hypothetical protein